MYRNKLYGTSENCMVSVYVLNRWSHNFEQKREITPNLPSSCPSLVYLADMYDIYKSYVTLLIKKTSFELKHCKIETVIISRSAQAAKLKKTYF